MPRYVFNVEMSCSGCSGALNKILARQKEKGEVTDFQVDLSSKTVNVVSMKDLDAVTAMLAKSGKKVSHLSTQDA